VLGEARTEPSAVVRMNGVVPASTFSAFPSSIVETTIKSRPVVTASELLIGNEHNGQRPECRSARTCPGSYTSAPRKMSQIVTLYALNGRIGVVTG
jgi:hypothetical protein